MAMKKKKGSSKKKKSEKKASSKKTKVKKEPKLSRKSFIIDLIKGAGKKGISVKSIVEKTDTQFEYGEGKSSRMRVNNTIKEAVGNKDVANNDGTCVWKG